MNNENSLRKSETDWARIDAMTDEDIDFSDCPEITDEMWENNIVRKKFNLAGNTSQETLAIDRDIIEFFKSQERDYQTKINQLLRAYMETHQTKS